MKKEILTTLLLIVSINCFSQKNNIYVETLERFTTLLDTGYKWKAEEIYFEKMNWITDSFPNKVGPYKIVVISIKEKEKILEDGKNIYLYRFSPLIFKNGIFSVEVTGFGCNVDGKIIVNAGYRYTYYYNCEEQKFTFIRMEGGGI
jgi:hypothetical protein